MLLGITAANGRLGSSVIKHLLERDPSQKIIAIARNVSKLEQLKSKGVEIRTGDYEVPASLPPALAGVDTLLLISSPTIGSLLQQHKNAVDAAVAAGVKKIFYTSVLNVTMRSTSLSEEHKQTEAYIKTTKLHYCFLRCGWYLENWTDRFDQYLQMGGLPGCAKDGKWSGVTINDLGAGIANILKSDSHKEIYELAGDESFTLADLASEIASGSGQPFKYNDMPYDAFVGMLSKGVPEFVAKLMADYYESSLHGDVFNDSKDLSKAMGRPTEDWRAFIRNAARVATK